MKFVFTPVLVLAFAAAPLAAGADPVGTMLDRYRQQQAGPFDANDGRALWLRDFNGRSCTTCHGDDLRQSGKHARTGKPIEPMAPSVNPVRLTDEAKMAKWLLRNCKWTLGRECSAQEKGDLLSWLKQQ